MLKIQVLWDVVPCLCRNSYQLSRRSAYILIFFHGTIFLSKSGPPHCRGFTITLRHATLGRKPLGEWSDRRRDFYLTRHNTHNTQKPCSIEIRIHNLSKRAAADPRLRPRDHYDLPSWPDLYNKLTSPFADLLLELFYLKNYVTTTFQNAGRYI
jgi:hypothetical protein